MNSKSLLPFCLTVCLLTVSCQEDPEPPGRGGIDPPNPIGEFEVRELQVVLPEDSAYDLTGSELFSLGERFPEAGDGKTSRVSISSGSSIVYLFDKDNNPVMAGFVTDAPSAISVNSTAQVLLFHAMGLTLREDSLVPLFISQIGELPDAVAWAEEFIALWKSDPLIPGAPL